MTGIVDLAAVAAQLGGAPTRPAPVSTNAAERVAVQERLAEAMALPGGKRPRPEDGAADAKRRQAGTDQVATLDALVQWCRYGQPCMPGRRGLRQCMTRVAGSAVGTTESASW